jgi:nucleoside triphosphate diphosphatase
VEKAWVDLAARALPALYPAMERPNHPKDIESLLEIMRRLRDPAGGCPWDREQTFATIAPYTIEEAYEVTGAIEDEDWVHLERRVF